MTTPAVAAPAPASALKPPFAVRGLMAAWNALYLRPTTVAVDPLKGEAWNRGAYLVEGLGHCSACHTERNALGAERTGPARLAGGTAEGWDAPAINGTATGPVGWTEAALYAYLRDGHAADHGSAGGPMAAVVKSLAPLPDADIRAMAVYLASFPGTATPEAAAAARTAALTASEAAKADAALVAPEGARLFEGACAACHEADGTLAPLALNSPLHADRPANLIRTILHGAEAPASLAARPGSPAEVMSMPAFAASLTDRQIAALATYLRARFAPGKPAWTDVEAASADARRISSKGG